MQVYRRYFKVSKGPLIDRISEIKKINEQAHSECMQIIKEVGADSSYFGTRGKIVAFSFSETPCTKTFKKHSCGGWTPKHSTKLGKAIVSKLGAIKSIDEDDALEEVGLHRGPRIFNGFTAHIASLVVIPSEPLVAFVQCPWFDADPEKLAAYKKNKEAGIEYYADFEAIGWVPTDDMDEVKEWEMMRDIDAWNDSLNKSEEAA